MLRLTLLLLLFCLCLPAIAQQEPQQATAESPPRIRYLVLDKPGRLKRIRFYPGDQLRFRLHDDPTRYRGRLQQVYSKAVVVDDALIGLHEFRSIRVVKGSYGAGFAGRSGGSLLGGSLLLLVAGSLEMLGRGQQAEDGKVIVLAGAGCLVTGLALRRTTHRTYRLNAHRRLRSI